MARINDPYSRVVADLDKSSTQITFRGKNREEGETLDLLVDAIARFGEQHIDDARFDAEAQIPDEVIRAMDDTNVAAVVNLDGGWGRTLDQNIERMNKRYPGRFMIPGLSVLP